MRWNHELIRETFFRKPFIWVVHVADFAIYALFWLLFLPNDQEAGMFLCLAGPVPCTVLYSRQCTQPLASRSYAGASSSRNGIDAL